MKNLIGSTIALITILFLYPLDLIAQELDFSGKVFNESINLGFWERNHYPDIVESGLPAQVVFNCPVRFSYATFHAKTDFSLAKFNYTIDFDGSKFDSTANFWLAVFGPMANFGWVKFGNKANFSWAVFGFANFKSAKFNSTADFSETTFGYTADFISAKFNSTVDFSKATFGYTADFRSAKFNSTADFSETTIGYTADFRSAEFNSTANFVRTKFNLTADFSAAVFNEGAEFSGAILPDYLDFRSVKKIQREIDFTFAVLNSHALANKTKCKIALFGSDIEKIKINMNLFELWFPDTLMTNDQKASVYELIGSKLKADGLMESYEILDIEYRHFKYRAKNDFYSAFLNIIDQWWWNYGYTKERILVWSFGFFLLFAVINLPIYHKLMEEVYSIGFLEKVGRYDFPAMTRLLFHFIQTTTYTAMIFFGLKMDLEKFHKGGVRKHPIMFMYLIFIYVLGLICMGFIINLIFSN